jgi:MoxR-like ATPase
MNSAAPAVQAAAYQLILNRRVGKYQLPENVVMVAAGNRESDKGVTYRMPTPLANRFIHLEMKV